jgi:VanZ family protein
MRYKFRTIFTALLILCVCVIFIFGSQDGNASEGTSDKVVDLIIEIFDMNLEGDNKAVFSNYVRAAAHVIEFAVMGLLAFLTFVSYTRLRYTERIYYPLVCCIVVACIDEFIQGFIPGRDNDLHDVALDGAGAIVMILLCAALVRWIKPLYALVEYKSIPKMLYEGSPNLLDDEFIKNSGLKGMTVKNILDEIQSSNKSADSVAQGMVEEDLELPEELPSEAEAVVNQYYALDSAAGEQPLEETDSLNEGTEPLDEEIETFELSEIFDESVFAEAEYIESTPQYIEPTEEITEEVAEEIETVAEEIAPLVLENEIVTEIDVANEQSQPETEESVIEVPIIEGPVIEQVTPEEPSREEVIAKRDRPIKSYPKRFPLSEELYYAASVIGKVNIEAAKRNERFANTAAPTRKNMERIYLTLGKTEHTKMEIVDVLNSDVSYDEKINLINKEEKDTYEYFDSIIPQ